MDQRMDPFLTGNIPHNQHPYQQNPQEPQTPYSQQSTQLSGNINLTPEELNTLKECQRNAVILRGFPLGFASMGGCYYLMQKGLLRKNMVSLLISGISGCLLGVASYRGICLEKLLSLPNSTLKERILIAQGKRSQVSVDVDSKDSFFNSVFPSEDPPMTSAIDIEPYQTHQFDTFSNSSSIDPDSAYSINPPLQPAQQESFTSYDELRRQNRENYERNYNRGPQQPGAPPPSSSYSQPPPSYAPTPSHPSQSPSYDSRAPYNDRPPAYDQSFDVSNDRPRQDDFLR